MTTKKYRDIHLSQHDTNTDVSAEVEITAEPTTSTVYCCKCVQSAFGGYMRASGYICTQMVPCMCLDMVFAMMHVFIKGIELATVCWPAALYTTRLWHYVCTVLNTCDVPGCMICVCYAVNV